MRARSAASVVLGAAVAVAACGGDVGGPPAIPSAAIAYVDGATAAVVTRGRIIVLEGYGFGTVRGAGVVTFASQGGGVTVALVPDSASWSDFAIEVVVPPDAVTGSVTVDTDAGERLTTTVHVLPSVPFDPAALAWQPRAGFPRAPVGVALAAAEYATSGGFTATLYAAGGAEPLGGDSAFVPETGVHVARTTAGGEITAWVRQPESATSANRSLPAPRAFAAAAVATPHNSRLSSGAVLYVIGGIDEHEQPQRTVYGANLSTDSVVSAFVALEPLPVPIAGAVAIVRRGSVYVLGGADSAGQPVSTVYVARVTPGGLLDGWYVQPATPGPRAYGGGTLIDRRVAVFGGFAEPIAPGGGLDPTPPRLASGDTGLVSRRSGFFTGPWGGIIGPVLPEPRSQFATLDVGTALLVVGGMYAGAAADAAETLAAATAGDSLGAFTGPVGTATIAGQGGGTLVGPAGATWRDAAGGWHGLVLGGMDLATRLRRTGVWGF